MVCTIVIYLCSRESQELGSAIDSITQNEESKIAYDYVMMLHNNIFKHMVYYFKDIHYLKHTKQEKIWKQQQTENRIWWETTARKYKVNSMALNLNHNIEKIIDGNPFFLCFCPASWFSKILSWFSKIFHGSLLLLAHRNILVHLILVGGMYLDQVPRCQEINSNNFGLYFLLLSLF